MDRYDIHALPKSFDSTYICPACQRDFFSEKVGRHYCPNCGLRITIDAPTQAEEVAALVAGTDWDKKATGSKIQAFINTTLAGMLRPRSFFAEVARSDKKISAFTYAYWMQVICSVVFFFGYLLLAPLFKAASPLEPVTPMVTGWITYLGIPTELVWIGVSLLFFLVMLAVYAAALALGIFLASAWTHACLFLAGGITKPFSSTYRAIAYTYVITPLMIIPLLNILVALYAVWLSMLAIARAHGVSCWRVLFSWLLPFVLIFVFALGWNNFMK